MAVVATEDLKNKTKLNLSKKDGKGSSSAQKEVHRVVISKASSEALESVLHRCVEGFDSGSITKSDVANYIFQNVSKFFSENDIRNLRAAHFDEKKVLGSILRAEEDLPEDVIKALRAHYGVVDKDKKKSVRVMSELSTKPHVDNSKM